MLKRQVVLKREHVGSHLRTNQGGRSEGHTGRVTDGITTVSQTQPKWKKEKKKYDMVKTSRLTD